MSERMLADLLVENVGALYTLAGGPKAPRRAEKLREVGLIEDGAVAAYRGEIVTVGHVEDVRRAIRIAPGARLIDAEGRAVVPGFVDPHTHAVFGSPRSREFGRRLSGESYQSIAAAEGGIRASVREFRELDEQDLGARTRERLRSALRYGTTTLEIKSGYGLDLESELKALRVVRTLSSERGLPRIVATCLAAHEVPDEYRERRAEYLDLVCDEILPEVQRQGLAERVDVFCEPGVFSPDEARRVLEAGRRMGLRATVHADELEGSGGAELAAELGADSADHLGQIGPAGIDALAESETVAVLLPGTIFSLGLKTWAPAREMIDRNVAVALASDFNPGSSYCESIPLTMAIACTRMHLHPHEALSMVTINAAWALRRAEQVGSLESGKRCDLIILRSDSVDTLCHHLGLDEIQAVVLDGQIQWDRSRGFPS
jgi:imidazolonepropionase